MSDWIQSHWFELGILATQFAALAVVVWFARQILRILSVRETRRERVAIATPSEETATPLATEPQVEYRPAAQPRRGNNGSALRQKEYATARPSRPVYGGVPHVLSPLPTAVASSAVDEPDWTAEPAFSRRAQQFEGADESGADLWRSVIRWLQTPIFSHATVPWRRVIRQLS